MRVPDGAPPLVRSESLSDTYPAKPRVFKKKNFTAGRVAVKELAASCALAASKVRGA